MDSRFRRGRSTTKRRLLAGTARSKKCEKATRYDLCDREERLQDFSLLADLQRVVYLDSEVPDSAFKLGMTEQ
jgi:hypothetical protein